jgi:hypothetical protein
VNIDGMEMHAAHHERPNRRCCSAAAACWSHSLLAYD